MVSEFLFVRLIMLLLYTCHFLYKFQYLLVSASSLEIPNLYSRKYKKKSLSSKHKNKKLYLNDKKYCEISHDRTDASSEV